jgi:glycosyltransferase involved in cell wall biosynthesis
MSATGGVQSKEILSLFGELSRWIYRGCDRILIQSRAFRESVLQRGVNGKRIHYLPNFAEEIFQPFQATTDNPEASLMPTGFRVMFAGNIGKSQDFETIISAAEMTQTQPNIQWTIIGDGRQKAWLMNELSCRALNNVHMLSRHPKERMPVFFSMADVLLVSLKKEPMFALTIPSKIQAYLACGKPIIASLDGEGARIIKEANAGMTVPSENPQELAEAVIRLSQLSPDLLTEMGINARKYYDAHFSRTHILDKFEDMLSSPLEESDNNQELT